MLGNVLGSAPADTSAPRRAEQSRGCPGDAALRPQPCWGAPGARTVKPPPSALKPCRGSTNNPRVKARLFSNQKLRLLETSWHFEWDRGKEQNILLLLGNARAKKEDPGGLH